MVRDVPLRGALIDRLTQRWVMATGRPVDVDGPERWLDGPVGAPDTIGDDWIGQHAVRVGARLDEGRPRGLLPDVGALWTPDTVGVLSPTIVDFYEHTSEWSIDVWSHWSRWAEPGGRLLNALFARRLRQLSLPTDPLAVAHGMESRVVFPLPNGSLTVFLRPDVTADGGLTLTSGDGAFGDDGAYLVVRPVGTSRGWARRVPLHERFVLFVDVDGVRCDHHLDLGSRGILRLHYRLRRSASH